MLQKGGIFIAQNNIKGDSLSNLLKEFTFEPHAFGHQQNNTKAVCDFRIIGDYELIFVVGGKSFITVEQTVYELGMGDIILIPPFVRHKIETDLNDPHDNFWIHFDVYPFYRQKEFRIMLSHGIREFGVHQFMTELLPLFRQMELEMEKGEDGSKAYFETLFLQLIIHLLRHNYDEKVIGEWNINQTSAEKEIVDKGMQFILQNLESPIQVKDICAYLHISESYLYKTYSKVMNSSPNYQIQLCKVKRAEQLLKTTAYSVKEISEILCFSSQYYFSTVFKNFYGVSPSRFIV